MKRLKSWKIIGNEFWMNSSISKINTKREKFANRVEQVENWLSGTED
jgi:hypothetical protein